MKPSLTIAICTFVLLSFFQTSYAVSGVDIGDTPKKQKNNKSMISQKSHSYFISTSVPQKTARILVPDHTLDQIRIIPVDSSLKARADSLEKIIQAAPSFQVNKFTFETKSVPDKARARLKYETTIRYFHPDDAIKADALKKLLIDSGLYVDATTSIESMLPYIPKTMPNYVEIWLKRP